MKDLNLMLPERGAPAPWGPSVVCAGAEGRQLPGAAGPQHRGAAGEDRCGSATSALQVILFLLVFLLRTLR